MIELYKDVNRKVHIDDDHVVENLSTFLSVCSTDFSVQSDDKVDISDIICQGAYHPKRFLTNGYAIYSSLSLFVFRAPFNQSMVLFNYNERSVQLDELVDKQLHGVLSSPWIVDITTDMMFDLSCPMSMTFFCLEKHVSKFQDYCDDLNSCHKIISNTSKSKGIQRDLRFSKVKV